MQLITQHFGGIVVPADNHEYGKAKLKIEDKNSPIFKNIDDNKIVWMSHGDRVETLPNGFKVIGTSENSPYAAIANEEKKIYAFQFHPEVVHTAYGATMLKNFAKYRDACGKEAIIALMMIVLALKLHLLLLYLDQHLQKQKIQ